MKKLLLMCVLLMSLVLAACSSEEAKSSDTAYPERPIEVIVPFAPGGSTDIGGRILEKYLPKYLPDSQFVIVNKPGGSGTIALSDLFASKPDGYTVALTTHRALALQPLYGKTKYN